MEKAEQCKEVYAYFGLAMYRAQCVEQSIIQLIIFFDFFNKHIPNFTSKEKWIEDYDVFDGSLSSKTMGQLINNLNNLEVINPSIQAKLSDALKKRNWLAHTFFVDRALNFISESGRAGMIEELESCVAYFNEVEDILNPITHMLCEKYGLTEDIRSEIEMQLFKEAEGDI